MSGLTVRRPRGGDAERIAGLSNGINSIGREAPPVTMTAEHLAGMILIDRAFAALADTA